MKVEIQYPTSNRGKTTIDNAFIEDHLACAPSEYVKVYIIALSKLPQNSNQLNIMEIARTLSSGLIAILKALEYWREKGILDIIEDKGFEQVQIYDLEQVRNYEKIKLVFKNRTNLPVKDELQAIRTQSEEQFERLSEHDKKERPISIGTNVQEIEMNTSDSFREFITKLEYMRKGKTLSYEAIRRLAYYKNNLGLSVELLELACSLSYDNPNVKESNHLNYARGILNNFYEANIFTLEDYYRRERQKDYKIPSPEEVESNDTGRYKARYSNVYKEGYTGRTRENRTGAKKAKYERSKGDDVKHENAKINKIQQNIDAQRMNMRKKLSKNMNNR